MGKVELEPGSMTWEVIIWRADGALTGAGTMTRPEAPEVLRRIRLIRRLVAYVGDERSMGRTVEQKGRTYFIMALTATDSRWIVR
jgi:hypothetical protein